MTETKNEAAAEWVSLDAVTPWEENPRNNAEAVAKVAASIKRFGFASPIIARKADGMVIAGHTRLAAATSLGLDRVPVRFLDIDPADARLLALADNRLGEEAAWDHEQLSAVLKDLDVGGFDLAATGFSEDELSTLMGTWVDPFAGGPEDEPEGLHDTGVARISITVANTAAARVHAILRENLEAEGITYTVLSS